MAESVRVEFAERARSYGIANKVTYRLAHWPIWIAVFFLAPGPLYLPDCSGYRCQNWAFGAWLGVVLAGPGIAALRGRLPGVEPCPVYHTVSRRTGPNPRLCVTCYTLAFERSFHLLRRVRRGRAARGPFQPANGVEADLRLRMVSCCGNSVWVLGALGLLPRVKALSTRGEGHQRRYLLRDRLGRVSQPVLFFLWKTMPREAAWKTRSSSASSS